MSAIYSITPDKLSRLTGTAACPVLVDVRTDEDFEADPHFIPGAVRRSHADVAEWAPSLADKRSS
jgi:rhodanese-related sulfurtransferase